MPKRGTLGHDMMFRSCTIQVQLLGTSTFEVCNFASGCKVMCNTSSIRAGSIISLIWLFLRIRSSCFADAGQSVCLKVVISAGLRRAGVT